MIQNLVTIIQNVFLPLGAWGIFGASIIEEVIAPIPSSLVMTGGGFFLLHNESFSPILLWKLATLIALPAALGVTIGSLLVYFIAYYSGRPALERWGKYFGLSWEGIESARARFSATAKDEWVLFFFRFVAVIPNVILNAVAGLVRMPLKNYVIVTFLGSLCRAFALGFLGWKLGDYYEHYIEYIDRFEWIGLIAFIFLCVLFVVYRIFKHRQKKNL